MSTENPVGHYKNPLMSGHKIVDELYRLEKSDQINFNGPVIPWTWVKKLRGKSGQPHWIAIFVLSDVVNHYRSKPDLAKEINLWKLKKRFKNDLYHLREQELAKKVGVIPKSISRALTYLKKKGLIICSHNRKISGVMWRKQVFVEPILDAVQKLTVEVVTGHESPKGEELLSPHRNTLTSPLRKDSGGANDRDSQVPSRTEGIKEQEKTLTTNNTNTRGPSPAASDRCGVGGDDNNSEERQPADKAAKIFLGHLQVRYAEWNAGEKLKLPSSFLTDLIELQNQIDITWIEILHYLSFSWIHAFKTPLPEEDAKSKFDPSWHSDQCRSNLNLIFNTNQKKRQTYFLCLMDEVYRFGNFDDFEDQHEEQEQWNEQLHKYRKKKSAKAIETVGGRKLADPTDLSNSSWAGLDKALRDWHQFGDQYKPNALWFQKVVERFSIQNREKASGHASYYDSVLKALVKLKLMPDQQPQPK